MTQVARWRLHGLAHDRGEGEECRIPAWKAWGHLWRTETGGNSIPHRDEGAGRMQGILTAKLPRTWIGLLGLVVLCVLAYLTHERFFHFLETVADSCKPVFVAIGADFTRHGILAIALLALLAILAFLGYWLHLLFKYKNESIK